MKIKKGDTVKVLSGKDRGKKAKVVRVLPKESRLVVEGLNLKKKHQRSRRQDKKGEMVLMAHPMAYSAVQLVCPSCSRPTRVGEKTGDNGRKVRICKKCGKDL
ncbi:MAG: 50S ribosomal protein L24 [Candidatus Sungbacteria bacterium]|nr:50S ribosomal protein L24 [Candidatus Sungbacteria bacterium]